MISKSLQWHKSKSSYAQIHGKKLIFNSIKKNGIAEISFHYFIDWKREYRITNSTLAFFFILQGP